MTDPLVSTSWLADHLSFPSIRILDCRYYFDDLARGPREYGEAHIPGALYLDWTRRYVDAGVTPEGDIVAYCQGGVRAAHTALALTRLGYRPA